MFAFASGAIMATDGGGWEFWLEWVKRKAGEC